MKTLPTTRLGRTEMHVTRTGFGARAIGGGGWAFTWGNQDDAASVAAIRDAVESGIPRPHMKSTTLTNSPSRGTWRKATGALLRCPLT